MLRRFIHHPTVLLILLIILLLVPTYWRMLKPGIYSMHDFHIFRLYEYDKCIADGQFPCRWAPDAAFEYGQPLFNFYGQLPYAFGEIFRFAGLSVLDSIKALFISSLIFSALGMFLLGKQIWGNNWAGLVSALVYVYAPYRAVDVYVRGALPEALAFVFFPIITYFFNDFIQKKQISSLVFFSISFAGLIITHNLSALMFLFFLVPWTVYKLVSEKAWLEIPKLVLAAILIIGLTAFYTLPLIMESNLISIQSTTGGYYDFTNHFVTLNQLLISRYWGYGASLWGSDDRLSLSVGHVQWILPLFIGLVIIIRRSWRKYYNFYFLLFLGWGILWLSHNKSTWLWETLSPISYIQFPWRFLGSAVFVFAFASGAILTVIKQRLARLLITLLIITFLIALNTGFFFEDLWYKISDKEFFSGPNYQVQIASAVGDFWPKYGSSAPTSQAPKNPMIINGEGKAELIEKRSDKVEYRLEINSPQAIVQIPIVFFPGWEGFVNGQQVRLYPGGKLGLITIDLNSSAQKLSLVFKNSPPRSAGNTITLFSLLVAGFIIIREKTKKIII